MESLRDTPNVAAVRDFFRNPEYLLHSAMFNMIIDSAQNERPGPIVNAANLEDVLRPVHSSATLYGETEFKRDLDHVDEAWPVDDHFRSAEQRILRLLQIVRDEGQVVFEIRMLQRLETVREKQGRIDDGEVIAQQIEILEHRFHLSSGGNGQPQPGG